MALPCISADTWISSRLTHKVSLGNGVTGCWVFDTGL